MTNFKGIRKIKEEQANNEKLELDIVSEYRNAVSVLFNTVSFKKDFDNKDNKFYCYETIFNFKTRLDDEIEEDINLSQIDDLKMFNTYIEHLLIDIVRFFMAIEKYDGKDIEINAQITINYKSIKDNLKKLSQFDLKLIEFSKNGAYIIANEIKDYCLCSIKKSIYFLNNNIYIDIEKCPLKIDFDNVLYKLEHSIRKNSIDYIPKLNKNEDLLETTIPKYKLSLKQIALKYVFENNHITIDNSEEIAKVNGYNSGKKLLQHYTFFYDRNNRKSKPFPYTITTLKNKIKLFEIVIERLDEEFKNKANDELNILKGHLSEFL